VTQKWPDTARLILRLAVAGAIFYLLYQSSQYNFLLFHTLAELFSIIIASSIFIVAWNTRDYLENSALLFIGIAFMAIGAMDLAHTLSYEGMNIFWGYDANLPTQLWIAARYLQGITFLIAPFLIGMMVRAWQVFLAYGLICMGLLAAIFFGLFPDAYVEGQGLTLFKTGSEYLICLILAAAMLVFIQKNKYFSPSVLRWLVLAIAWTIGSELMFTAYLGVYDTANLIGHYLKIVAFYMLYKAVTETGMTRPFELLFQNLQQSRDDLRRERDFVSTILDTSYALLMVVDKNGCILRFNQALENSTGYRQEEVQRRYLWETGIFPETHEQIEQIHAQVLIDQTPYRYDGHINNRENRNVHIAWSIAPSLDPQQQIQYTIWTGIDITERVQAEDELRYLSTHDTLTGLYNRAYFEAEMVRLAETDRFPASIVVADVDGLKVINDTFGHLAGDKLLQRAAHILRSAFRAEDVVARMGGDEFAVLLADAEASVAEHGQRRVNAILAAHNQVNPGFPINMSLGWATAESGYMLMETFKHADQAMYLEKNHRTTRSSEPPAGQDDVQLR